MQNKYKLSICLCCLLITGCIHSNRDDYDDSNVEFEPLVQPKSSVSMKPEDSIPLKDERYSQFERCVFKNEKNYQECRDDFLEDICEMENSEDSLEKILIYWNKICADYDRNNFKERKKHYCNSDGIIGRKIGSNDIYFTMFSINPKCIKNYIQQDEIVASNPFIVTASLTIEGQLKTQNQVDMQDKYGVLIFLANPNHSYSFKNYSYTASISTYGQPLEQPMEEKRDTYFIGGYNIFMGEEDFKYFLNHDMQIKLMGDNGRKIITVNKDLFQKVSTALHKNK